MQPLFAITEVIGLGYSSGRRACRRDIRAGRTRMDDADLAVRAARIHARWYHDRTNLAAFSRDFLAGYNDLARAYAFSHAVDQLWQAIQSGLIEPAVRMAAAWADAMQFIFDRLAAVEGRVVREPDQLQP